MGLPCYDCGFEVSYMAWHGREWACHFYQLGVCGPRCYRVGPCLDIEGTAYEQQKAGEDQGLWKMLVAELRKYKHYRMDVKFRRIPGQWNTVADEAAKLAATRTSQTIHMC